MSESAAYRALVRLNPIDPGARRPRDRKWKRWERGAPMELWQLDVVGGFVLADGTRAKALTGVDDHARFCVSARLMSRESSRAVCAGLTAALGSYGCPEQTLTDNGKVFTGRFNTPPVEALFDRISSGPKPSAEPSAGLGEHVMERKTYGRTRARGWLLRMTLRSNHSEVSVHDLLLRYRARQLNLEPAFQRKPVWTVSDRRQLVLSVLAGMPLPTIYLYKNTGRAGKTQYDVIDGKQRIETLLLFMGKGPLGRDDALSVQTALDGCDAIEWWDWRSLPKEVRNSYLDTKLHTIEVDGDLSEIIQLFVRINSTGAKLTPAERRNAEFLNEPALQATQKLAGDLRRWFTSRNVLSGAQIKRSKDVELVCELLLSIHAGAPLNKKSRIDELIGGGGVTKADARAAGTSLKRAVKLVDAVLPDLKTTRFRQLADFYTLVMLLHRLHADGYTVTAHDSARNALAGDLLREFGRGVDEVAELQRKVKQPPPIFEPHVKYLLTVREGTDSSKQRIAREQILRDVLAGVFGHLDTNRLFNKTQRRILWHAAKNRACSWCKKPIVRWEDAHVDHVDAYVKGGKTDLRNARLLHARCNKAKGAGPPRK